MPAQAKIPASSWSIGRILRWTQDFFTNQGIHTARLDAEILLAHCLGVDRVYLYTHFDQPLSSRERSGFRQLLLRRARREPVAYILGEREFYGRAFQVTPSVLVPRPETEHVVEEVLAWVAARHLLAPRILDIGTGSGAIAVTLAAQLTKALVVASDVSAQALAVARANAARHGVGERIEWVEGAFFAPWTAADGAATQLFDVVVANPPYIDPAERGGLEPEVRDFEPELALFAAQGGMANIACLAASVHRYLKPQGFFACEIGATQAAATQAALAAAYPYATVRVVADLQGLPRVVLAAK